MAHKWLGAQVCEEKEEKVKQGRPGNLETLRRIFFPKNSSSSRPSGRSLSSGKNPAEIFKENRGNQIWCKSAFCMKRVKFFEFYILVFYFCWFSHIAGCDWDSHLCLYNLALLHPHYLVHCCSLAYLHLSWVNRMTWLPAGLVYCHFKRMEPNRGFFKAHFPVVAFVQGGTFRAVVAVVPIKNGRQANFRGEWIYVQTYTQSSGIIRLQFSWGWLARKLWVWKSRSEDSNSTIWKFETKQINVKIWEIWIVIMEYGFQFSQS